MTPRKKAQHGGRRRGAGRPPTLRDPIMLNVRIDGEVFDHLGQLADAAGQSLSEYVRRLLKRHIDRKGGWGTHPQGLWVLKRVASRGL